MTRGSRSRRGISPLELIVGLAVLGIVLAVVGGLASFFERRQAARTAGQHIQALGAAALAYVEANAAALDASASSGPIQVDLATVLASGAGFSGLTTSSPLNGQTICMVVRRASPGVLEPMLLSTGGSAASSIFLGDVQQAGEFMTGIVDAGAIYGPRSGWIASAANYTTPGCAPADGHFAYALFVNGSLLSSTALNRFYDPSRPERTRMSAHLMLQSTCDDPSTAAAETTSECQVRPIGLGATEPGLALGGIRLLNSLMTGNFPSTYNSGNFTFAGDVMAASFLYTSDPTLKADMTPLDRDQVERLYQVSGYIYRHMDHGGRREIGFSAAEWARLFPEVTSVDRRGKLAMDYTRAAPILVEALKRQRQQLDEQSERIARLEAALGTAHPSIPRGGHR